MRRYNLMQPKCLQIAVTHKPRQARKLASVAVLTVLAVLLGTQGTYAAAMAESQTPKPQAESTTAQKPLHPHKRSAAAHSQAQKPVQAPVAQAPVTPPPPDWPANNKPAKAIVVWNSAGLRIEAANASLQQILKDVATATGAKVEGIGKDERVYGSFGPGTARDVVSQLLDGSGYNVLMIGDQGQGTPRQIVLTLRHALDTPAGAANATTATNDEDADPDDPPTAPPPPAIRNGFAPGGPPRTPQQIMQEMQQRQQQMQQRSAPQ